MNVSWLSPSASAASTESNRLRLSPFALNGPKPVSAGRQSKRALSACGSTSPAAKSVSSVGVRRARRRCLCYSAAAVCDDAPPQARAPPRSPPARRGGQTSSPGDDRELRDDDGPDGPPSSNAGIEPFASSSSWSSAELTTAVSGAGVASARLRSRSRPEMSCSTWLSAWPVSCGSLSSSSNPTPSRMSLSERTPKSLAPVEGAEPGLGVERPLRGDPDVARDRPAEAREPAELEVGSDETAGAIALGAERDAELVCRVGVGVEEHLARRSRPHRSRRRDSRAGTRRRRRTSSGRSAAATGRRGGRCGRRGRSGPPSAPRRRYFAFAGTSTPKVSDWTAKAVSSRSALSPKATF